ncbi:MAG: hypothetical protein P8188_09330 [Gemmatimonadota bacterium]
MRHGRIGSAVVLAMAVAGAPVAGQRQGPVDVRGHGTHQAGPPPA